MWSIPTTHPTIVSHSRRITIVAKPLESHNHHWKNPSRENFSDEIFQQPLLRHVDTPLGSPKPKLPAGAKISCIRFLKRLHAPPLSLTRRRVRVRDSYSGRQTSPPESPVARSTSLSPWFSTPTPESTLFPLFCVRQLYFSGFFFIFPTPIDIYKISGVVLPPIAPYFILQISYSCDLLLFYFYGYQRFNLFSYFGSIYCYYIEEISCIPLCTEHPNLHPLHLLPKPIMPLLSFHIPLDLGFLILEPLIIFSVIRIFFLLLPLHLLFPWLL